MKGIKKSLLNPKVISETVARIRKQFLHDVIELYLEMIEEVLLELILETPVDSGRARLHWKVNVRSDREYWYDPDYREAEPSYKVKLADGTVDVRRASPLSIGIPSPMVYQRISEELRLIRPALEAQIMHSGKTSVTFSNDTIYYQYLEDRPYGERHPHKLNRPWSDQNSGMIQDMEFWLKTKKLPTLEERIMKLKDSYKNHNQKKRVS